MHYNITNKVLENFFRIVQIQNIFSNLEKYVYFPTIQVVVVVVVVVVVSYINIIIIFIIINSIIFLCFLKHVW